jgi:hypothetical protein
MGDHLVELCHHCPEHGNRPKVKPSGIILAKAQELCDSRWNDDNPRPHVSKDDIISAILHYLDSLPS